MGSIYEFVKQQRDDYRSKTIQIADGYEFSQYETLRTIELYHNSRFLTSNKDSLGREKPFYNITKFRVNVATRATDIDTKNLKVVSDAADAEDASFILNLRNRNWMKQNAFAVFLNRFGNTRAKYGGVLVKKIEKDNDLSLHVMQWLNMITDQVDIRNGVKIERHYYTPSDLKRMTSWNNIDEAIAAAKKSRKAVAATPGGKDNQTPGSYIEVFEVHGVLPTCYLAGTSDKYPANYGTEDEYEQQMHVVVLDESDKENVSGVTLYAGIEDADPYKYLPYEEVDGRGLGVGVVEDLIEAQVWTNYSVQQKKDMLDLAGKIVWQTADSSIAAKNFLTDIENGTILTHAPNMPLQPLMANISGLGGLSQLMSDWNDQAENATSTYPAILGQTPPHGTAFRLQAGLVNEASALFEYRRQEAGLFIQEIYRDWILPFLVKQMKSESEVVADLDPDELKMLAEKFAEHQALKFQKDQILNGKGPVHQQDIAAIKHAARTSKTSRSRHSINDFGSLFDDWAGTIDVDTTGEQYDRQALLSTLFQLFSAVSQNPQLLENPTSARIFNEIIETAGASPVLRASGQDQPTPQPPQPIEQVPQGPQGGLLAPAPAPSIPPTPAVAPRT